MLSRDRKLIISSAQHSSALLYSTVSVMSTSELSMDFGKFRVGGELSDIEVVVSGNHFHLHRFPLYTRSGFFLKEFAKLGVQKVITLVNFTGGADAFTLIADFCYNISVDINVTNVIALRCGAKYLGMDGSGNLYEKTGMLIEEIMTNARRGKDLERFLTLLSTLAQYESNDTVNHALEQCVNTLVHRWNKSQYGMAALDDIHQPNIQAIIFEINFDFFIKFLISCKEKTTNHEVLNTLVSAYVQHMLDMDNISNISIDDGDATSTTTTTTTTASTSSTGSDDEHEAPTCRHPSPYNELSLRRIQSLLDILKPDLSLAGPVAWLKPLLEKYSKLEDSDSAEIIGSITAVMVNQMDTDCIQMMNEKTLLTFSDKVNTETLCEETRKLIIHHMEKLAGADALSTKGFMRILKDLKLYNTSSPDGILTTAAMLNSKGKKRQRDMTVCVTVC